MICALKPSVKTPNIKNGIKNALRFGSTQLFNIKSPYAVCSKKQKINKK